MSDPVITKQQAVKAIGSVPALADLLGITRSAVYQWPDGPIPTEQAYRLHYRRPDLFKQVARPRVRQRATN